MHEFPLVSIVIPNFNSAGFLAETLESALSVSYPNFEIVVVDDGSTDQSGYLLENWKMSHPEKIRVFYQSNQGPSVARNYGIHEASGKYILPLDSDDRIHPDYISRAVERFESDAEISLVYCHAEKFGMRDGPWKLREFSLEALALDNMIFVSALFKKADFKTTGGYDPRFIWGWEDWDFWINLLKNGGKVVQLPLTGFFYRIRKGSRRKSTDSYGKQQTILLLNRKHRQFFSTYLSGPLRNPRGISKIVNPILSPFASIWKFGAKTGKAAPWLTS